MTEPGGWWLNKAPRMGPGAQMRSMGPGQRPQMPRGGVPPMGPSYYGPPGNTASRAPSGPPQRNPMQPIDPFGWNTGLDSQYRDGRPGTPPGVIRDVDIGTNFFSPFQPILPFAPLTGNYAREWDYPVGVNLDYQPQRFGLMKQLRLMSQSWGLLRAVIERKKDQLLSTPWTFRGRDHTKANPKSVERAMEVFYKPDRKRRFQQWARLLLEDMFVVDAASIYIWRTQGDQVHAFEVLDGVTILPLIDDAGRIPDYPSPAYQQIIKGLPSIDLTERELLYLPMRPRPELPIYGYSPVEQIYLEATEGIRRTLYQLNFWTEGSLPEMIVTVPDNWSPQQIAMFQTSFDALLSGNQALKSKIRFVPGGMKPFDIKNANGEALKSEYDEWLARLVCYTFGVDAQPFITQMNRATAQVSSTAAKEEGAFPLQGWFKAEVMDRLLWEVLGWDDIEFWWRPKPPADALKHAQTDDIQVRNGLMSLNEGRDRIGMDPIADGDEHLIYTTKGPVPITPLTPEQIGGAGGDGGGDSSDSGGGSSKFAAPFVPEDERTELTDAA